MKCVAITSMNFEYFNNYGRVMAKSYSTRFNKDIPLIIYNEDGFSPKLKNVYTAGWDLGDEFTKFQNRWTENKKVTTFSKKGFSIIHAMNNIDCDRLIWIDADAVIEHYIPELLLKLISPDDVLSTHFGVKHLWEESPTGYAFSCETGFFILNKKHSMFEDFKKVYTDIYVNDRTTNLRRFYDGEVYGETVRIMEGLGAKMMELNPGHIHKTPISRSILTPYLSHNKASMKESVDYQQLESLLDENSESV